MAVSKEKGINNGVVIVIFSVTSLFLGMLIGGASTGSFSCPKCSRTPCPVLDTTNVHTDYDYLKDNACRLYSNYKSAYLSIDEQCNSDARCRGSAIQKEGYETYVGWKSFSERYCNE